MDSPTDDRSTERFKIQGYRPGSCKDEIDPVIVESPVEIRLVFGPLEKRRGKSLAITMRTPGYDFELAIGFLISENIVSKPDDILSISHVGTIAESEVHSNIVRVELSPKTAFHIEKLQRHFYVTSSCGICGKASLDSIRAQGVQPITEDFELDPNWILKLPQRLRNHQPLFQLTGGNHAAAIIDFSSEEMWVQEDVGRHNAVDKVVGSQFLANNFPLSGNVL
ncbi:MAG: formate dehydrogenase accessory sulfurtransferase FdhD, partial [Planctomycetota bacterium]